VAADESSGAQFLIFRSGTAAKIRCGRAFARAAHAI
jgi:hypothetical protein